MVAVRKMRPEEAEGVAKWAKEAKPPAAALEAAVHESPEHVRVAHIGHEVVGAFVLTELPGGVEEISSIVLTEEGRRAGAERAVVEYVVHAARFARKKAVEVVAHGGSAEARHLEREGFRPAGEEGQGARRFRIDVKREGRPLR